MKYSLIGFPAWIDVIFAWRKIHDYWSFGVRGSHTRLKTFTAITIWRVDLEKPEKNEYLVAIVAVHPAENEPLKVWGWLGSNSKYKLYEIVWAFISSSDLKQIEKGLLLAVIGLRRIARCRADALVFDLQHVIQAHVLVWRVAPKLLSNLDVNQLGVRLAQAICNRVEQNRLVNLAARMEPELFILMISTRRRGGSIQAACLPVQQSF